MKRSMIGALVAVLALGAVGTAFGAGTKTFNSQVKITGYNLGIFEGQVRSNFEKCEDKRGVELWQDNTEGDDSLLGDDKTDASGAWSVSDFGIGESFYAVARNKTGVYRKQNGKRKHYQCPEVISGPFVR